MHDFKGCLKTFLGVIRRAFFSTGWLRVFIFLMCVSLGWHWKLLPNFQEDLISNSSDHFFEIVPSTSVCGCRGYRMGPNLDAYGSWQSVPHGVRVFYGAQSAGFNFAGLMTARVVLGVFEAGFGPVITLYFCKPLFSFVIFGFLSTSSFFQLSFTPNGSLGFELVKSCKPFPIRWH